MIEIYKIKDKDIVGIISGGTYGRIKKGKAEDQYIYFEIYDLEPANTDWDSNFNNWENPQVITKAYKINDERTIEILKNYDFIENDDEIIEQAIKEANGSTNKTLSYSKSNSAILVSDNSKEMFTSFSDFRSSQHTSYTEPNSFPDHPIASPIYSLENENELNKKYLSLNQDLDNMTKQTEKISAELKNKLEYFKKIEGLSENKNDKSIIINEILKNINEKLECF